MGILLLEAFAKTAIWDDIELFFWEGSCVSQLHRFSDTLTPVTIDSLSLITYNGSRKEFYPCCKTKRHVQILEIQLSLILLQQQEKIKYVYARGGTVGEEAGLEEMNAQPLFPHVPEPQGVYCPHYH